MAAKTEKCEKFYHSTLWRKTRRAFLESVNYTCARCGAVGNLVHHKIPLDDKKVDDPHFSISFDNLECLCKSCHDSIHHKLEGRNGNENQYFNVGFDENGDVIISEKK